MYNFKSDDKVPSIPESVRLGSKLSPSEFSRRSLGRKLDT